MSGGLERLECEVRDFELEADLDFVDPKRLSAVIDRLQATLGRVVDRGRRCGDHQLSRLTPAGWVARTCGLSRKTAGDRLCVGRQLESLPQVAEALAKGEIGYQAVSAICHLREQLGERVDAEREKEMVSFARRFSVEHLRICCRHARAVADPEGFEKDSERDFERRWLEVSPLLDGMHSVDGILDPVTGAAFRAALDSLAVWRGPDDRRNHGQRMADALGELLQHHLDEGRLPRKNGVRPHITVNTTLEGLKGELGAAAAELPGGMPISRKTVLHLPARRGGRARVGTSASLSGPHVHSEPQAQYRTPSTQQT